MKPKSKYHIEIMRLYHRLPQISQAQWQWAKHNAHSHTAIDNGKTKRCTACGCRFRHPAQNGVQVVCPECRCRLNVKDNTTQCVREDYYFHIVTVIGEFQVVRNFIATRRLRRDRMDFDAYEASCSFIDANGRETCLGLKRTTFFWSEYWSRYSKMEIRRISRNSYYGNYGSYHPQSYLYPRTRFLPILQRNGITAECDTINLATLCSLLLTDPYYETLIKNKQYSMIRQSWHRDKLPLYTVRIANRHGYIVQDADLWADYIRDLEYLGYDSHNPRYLLPADLNAAHQRTHAKVDKIKAEELLRKKLAETAEQEDAYKAEKGRYFGVCFGNENIVITAIQSVAEMAVEGEEMHHCVFRNDYHKEPNSLILSAKDRAGRRIETIEVSLLDFSVLQSRGKYNQNTPQHEEILALVRDNINQIKHPEYHEAI